MIIGYEMYRNLTQGRNIKSKKLKEIFQKTLVDPGEVTALAKRFCSLFMTNLGMSAGNNVSVVISSLLKTVKIYFFGKY